MSLQNEKIKEHIMEYLKDKEKFKEAIMSINNEELVAKLYLLKFTIYNNEKEEINDIPKVERLLKNAQKENNVKAYRMMSLTIVLNLIENLELIDNGKEKISE